MIESTIVFTCSVEDLKLMINEVVMECLQKSQTPPENRLLTRQEACELLHIGMTTLSKCTKDGDIQGRRIGKRILYLESDVRAALHEMPNRKRWKRRNKVEDDDED
jgi:excisionase family DNA binding protein